MKKIVKGGCFINSVFQSQIHDWSINHLRSSMRITSLRKAILARRGFRITRRGFRVAKKG